MTMTPRTVRLSGAVGTELKGQVVIESNMEGPLELTPGNISHSDKLTYVLQEVEKGKKFLIHLMAKPSEKPERYQSFMKIRTNSGDQPWLRLHITVVVN